MNVHTQPKLMPLRPAQSRVAQPGSAQEGLALPAAAHPRAALPAPEHRHDWRTDSSHNTAEGVVRYARCHGCAAHRVELQPFTGVATPISREIGPAGGHPGAGGGRSA
ncbi:hypothetical protein [Leucobacter sp. BZR 635]